MLAAHVALKAQEGQGTAREGGAEREGIRSYFTAFYATG